MKKQAFLTLIMASAIAFLTGCSWSVGSSSTTPKTAQVVPTTGQQLIDLQKAWESGAISEPEYRAQKAKILGSK